MGREGGGTQCGRRLHRCGRALADPRARREGPADGRRLQRRGCRWRQVGFMEGKSQSSERALGREGMEYTSLDGLRAR